MLYRSRIERVGIECCFFTMSMGIVSSVCCFRPPYVAFWEAVLHPLSFRIRMMPDA